MHEYAFAAHYMLQFWGKTRYKETVKDKPLPFICTHVPCWLLYVVERFSVDSPIWRNNELKAVEPLKTVGS